MVRSEPPGPDEGGDPACWLHLVADDDDAEPAGGSEDSEGSRGSGDDDARTGDEPVGPG